MMYNWQDGKHSNKYPVGMVEYFTLVVFISGSDVRSVSLLYKQFCHLSATEDTYKHIRCLIKYIYII